jgi:quercetin dioxygenase-like cupin family protein
MKHTMLAMIAFSTVSLAGPQTWASGPSEAGMMLTPDQFKWEPNPRVAGLGVARIISNGTEAGPYVYRVKFPKGHVVQSHSHPDDRTYTVLEGTWYIGWGDKFEDLKLVALTPGSFYTEPAGVAHFVATPDGDAIVQITGKGPTRVDFTDPAHAPKKN